MFEDPQIQILIIVLLVALVAGSLSYFFLSDKIAAEGRASRRVEKFGESSTERMQSVQGKSAAASRLLDATKRKKAVEVSLQELEERQKTRDQKSTKPTLKQMIKQSGIEISITNFYLIALGIGVFGFLIAFILGQGLLLSLGVGVIAGLGLPHMVISNKRKRRINRFRNEFPDAIDILVRGVKAGLPVNDCFKIISEETEEPVCNEFKRIIEAQRVGLSLPEAVARLYENIPLPETNFFSIVITIQQKAGGNLAEALSNLSTVLRERKKMEVKVKAVSSEATSSAFIIGSLPIALTLVLYVLAPDYIGVIFTHSTGHMILLGVGAWMSVGIFVMHKMINFNL